ncbi:TolC family protein [Chlorobium sp. N1]|uniref:TolC family protein n=1 Tax=Chlorobium sp. N1 TaxID=2491138 RepID=UPI00103EA470|nr:TolC family protein [Chlorobium sp. N1]TCD48512.1 TolC family protein [Chlorobium sp. N1]
MPSPRLWLTALLILLLSPASLRSEEARPRRLTLDECLREALATASTGKKAEHALTLKGTDVLQSYGRFLPALTASGAYSPYRVSKGYSPATATTPEGYSTTKTESASATLSASINLFNGLGDYAALQAALKSRRAARLSLRRAYETIAYDVTQAYYQALLDRELHAIALEDLATSEDQLKLTENQFRVGLKSMTDRYQQEAEAASRRLAAIRAGARAERSLLELLRRIQRDPAEPVALADPPRQMGATPYALPPLDSLLQTALVQRADLRGSELETRAARWKLSQARGRRLPSIDATWTLSSDASRYLGSLPTLDDTPALGDQLDRSVGQAVSIGLSWTVFDGWLTAYQVQSARIGWLDRELDLGDLRRDIEIDLRQAYGDYRSALGETETAEVSLRAARSAYEAVRKKYELGAAGFVDLSAARAALFSARSSLTQARYGLELQKNVIAYATGTVPLPVNPQP